MAMDWLQHRARAARLLHKGWQKFARAFSLQALRRAWDRWGFYASLALVLALIGGGAAAIRNRPAPEIAPVAAMQPVLESPAPTASAAPAPPMQWPLEGEILVGHSPESAVYQPALGAFTAHVGIDIAGQAGDAVRAVADGTAAAFYASPSYGYVLEIEHPGGLVTRYGGLAAACPVQPGDRVSAGQTVGTLGSVLCGESYLGPHLHFETLEDGLSVDPETLGLQNEA